MIDNWRGVRTAWCAHLVLCRCGSGSLEGLGVVADDWGGVETAWRAHLAVWGGGRGRFKGVLVLGRRGDWESVVELAVIWTAAGVEGGGSGISGQGGVVTGKDGGGVEGGR